MEGVERRGAAQVAVVLAPVVAPVAAAVVLVPFRGSFAASAAALVLVAVIAAVAVLGSRGAGVVATIAATLAFDVFLTRPYERLAITHRNDVETAISLLVVGLVVTELAERARRHRRAASEEMSHVAALYELSELAAQGAPPNAIVAKAIEELEGVLELRECRFEPGGRATGARLEHDGTVHVGELVWGVESMGLPSRNLELDVCAHGQPVGRFVMQPTPGLPISLQRRLVAVAVADQVGAAL